MNTSQNKRFFQTENNIRDAFTALLSQKSFDSISIKELCTKAGISRTAFYAHFDDINDLIIKTEQEKSAHVGNLLLNDAKPKKELFCEYFQYLKDNRNFYLAYFSLNTGSYMSGELTERYIRTHKHCFSEAELRYHTLFFMAGLRATAYQWLLNGCKETPEKLSGILSAEYNLFDAQTPAHQ